MADGIFELPRFSEGNGQGIQHEGHETFGRGVRFLRKIESIVGITDAFVGMR